MAVRSRRQLISDLKSIGFHKEDIEYETYGKKTMAYVQFGTLEKRREAEAKLKKMGWNVNVRYGDSKGGKAEIQVSYLNLREIKMRERKMKRSELRQIIKEEIRNLIFHEGIDPMITKIGDIAKSKNLVDMRPELEKIFKKKDIDFTFAGAPHFRIKHGGRTIVVVNKKYADDAELTVGNIAIGYEGRI